MLLARNDGRQLGSVTLGYADYAADRDKALMAPGSVPPSTPHLPEQESHGSMNAANRAG